MKKEIEIIRSQLSIQIESSLLANTFNIER